MTATVIRFLFDFGSPNAYLAHRVIPAIEQRTGATFDYVPILLGGLFKLTGNRSPGEAYAEIPHKLAYEKLEMRRFIDRHGLHRFRANPHFPVNTLKMMRGAVAAQTLGCFDAYVEAMFVAMWEDGRDMSVAEEIEDVLRRADLDAAALMERSQAPEVKARLLGNTDDAWRHGAFGSPSFLVGNELYFGKDRLRDIEERLGEEGLGEEGRGPAS